MTYSMVSYSKTNMKRVAWMNLLRPKELGEKKTRAQNTMVCTNEIVDEDVHFIEKNMFTYPQIFVPNRLTYCQNIRKQKRCSGAIITKNYG